jgi:hypothetical protein
VVFAQGGFSKIAAADRKLSGAAPRDGIRLGSLLVDVRDEERSYGFSRMSKALR